MLSFIFKFDFKWCFSVQCTAMNLDLRALATFCRFIADIIVSPKLNNSCTKKKLCKCLHSTIISVVLVIAQSRL